MNAGNIPEESPRAPIPRWKRAIVGAVGGFLTGLFFWLDDPIGLGRGISWIIIAALTVTMGIATFFLSPRNAERLDRVLFQMSAVTDLRKGK